MTDKSLYITDYVDECYVDPLGNLIARKKAAAKVMFSAHADGSVSSLPTSMMTGSCACNVGGLNLLIAWKQGPFRQWCYRCNWQGKGELKDLTLDKLFIDIGADSKGSRKKVAIGDFAIFHREFCDLGQRLVAKSMDDRIGCAVLVEAIRRLDQSNHDLYFVFSAQEEVGARAGQQPMVLIPIWGTIDVTRTGDTPEAPAWT